jgi:hypothetical protein
LPSFLVDTDFSSPHQVFTVAIGLGGTEEVGLRLGTFIVVESVLEHASSEFVKERGRDHLVEQRGTQQSADDHHSQRVQDFLAGLTCAQG